MQTSRNKAPKPSIKFPMNPNEIEKKPKPTIRKFIFLLLRLRIKKYIEISKVVPINAMKNNIKVKYKIFVEMFKPLQ